MTTKTKRRPRRVRSPEERIALVNHNPAVFKRRYGGVTNTVRTWDPTTGRLRTVRGWVGRRARSGRNR